MSVRILIGDVRARLAELPDASVHMVCTSPPYYGLRDYGVAGQIGLEETPQAYIETMVAVFREVRRVLRADGTLWLNLGDSYAGSWGAQGHRVTNSAAASWHGSQIKSHPKRASHTGTIRDAGLKPKDLIGVPWQIAFALRDDGWWLRSALPWVKRNGMPENIGDRPASAVEYVFMLTRSARYWYDADAVRRGASPSTHARVSQNVAAQAGSARANGGAKTNGRMKAVIRRPKLAATATGNRANDSFENATCGVVPDDRNFRNADLFFGSLDPAFGLISLADGTPLALDVTPQGFRGAHFATFPPRLVEPLILAGCPVGGMVLDPFLGAGTTALVADRLGRDAIGIELNPSYAAMAERRIADDAGMFAKVRVA
jgi:DNA modification methylase